MFFLASAPSNTTAVSKMLPRYWTASVPRPANAAVTSAQGQLALFTSFRTLGDRATFTYSVADTISHPLLRYTDSSNYAGVIWSFAYSISGNLPPMNDPTSPPRLIVTLNDNSQHTVTLWNYSQPGSTGTSGSIAINFATVVDNTGHSFDTTQVASIQIVVKPVGFTVGSTTPLAAPVDGFLILSSFALTGLGPLTMPVGIYQPSNTQLRAVVRYDESASVTPERIVNEMVALGYANGETTLDWGALYRLDLQWYDANQAYQVANPFNYAAQQWGQSFCALLGNGFTGQNGSCAGVPVIHAFSLELSDQWTNPIWAQKDSYGNPAKTNVADPNANFIGAFMNQDFYQFLVTGFTQAIGFTPAGIVQRCALLRPQWWFNTEYIGNAPAGAQPPCFYDDATQAAYMQQFSTEAPVITDIAANLSSAQQAFAAWLLQQLGAFGTTLSAAVAAAWPLSSMSVRIDTTRLFNGTWITSANMPTPNWDYPAFSGVQIEDYSFVAPVTKSGHNSALPTATATFDYPLVHSTYVAGKASQAADWTLIEAAIEQALTQGWAQVYVFSMGLVSQYGYVFYVPTAPPPPSTTGTGSMFDFKNRLVRMYPNSWTRQKALNTSGPAATNGILGSLFMGIGYALSLVFAQLFYAKNQTRWRTRTDTNLDGSNADVFGTLWPRFSGEQDGPFSARTTAAIVECGPNYAGILAAVTIYLQALASTLTISGPVGLDTTGALDATGSLDEPVFQGQGTPEQLLADDSFGGLDTYGALDRAIATGNGPQVVVFDSTSNPGLSSLISPNIVEKQFCIYFRYPGYPDAAIHPISAYSQQLAAIIAHYKSLGVTVVWASNWN